MNKNQMWHFDGLGYNMISDQKLRKKNYWWWVQEMTDKDKSVQL